MRGTWTSPAIVLLVIALTSCSDGPDRAAAIEEAYTGPMTLNIREEISLKSPVVATVKHGEPLEVLAQRRRFLRVRTEAGIEGWCDSEKLLTTEQMDRLRAVADAASKLPSQGEATVYDLRNVHTEPHRLAPSFRQLQEEERFDVLAHRLVLRGRYTSEISRKIERASAPPPRKSKQARKKEKKKERKDGDIELPPMPRAPALPSNWRALSYRVPLPDPPKPAESKSPLALLIRQPQDLPQYEDWSLIRTKDGQAGWILTRSLTMTVPDEVARYAEGHRITSWFVLGETRDGEDVKKHYLWTTITRGGEPYEFDGFRIFVYSVRRHRYETGYREKNVRGYFPGALHPVEVTEGGKTRTVSGFSLVIEEDGGLFRKTYSFEGYRVRLTQREPWTRPDDPLDLKVLDIARPSRKREQKAESFWDRLKKRLPWSKKS